MLELDHKESWALKNWCFCTVVLEETLKSPLNSKEIQPVNPKENQSWVFTGRSDVEAKTPDSKNLLIGKDPDAGKYWRQEKGMTEDEMVGWHYWVDGYEFEQAPGFGDGQQSLAWCSPWDHKKSDTTEWLSCTELKCPYAPSSVLSSFFCFLAMLWLIIVCLQQPELGKRIYTITVWFWC